MSPSKYKQNFQKALRREPLAAVPFSLKFSVEAKARYAAFLNRPFDPVADTGSYVVASHTNAGWDEIRSGYFRDYFGVVWNKTVDKTLGIVDQPLLTGADFGGYRFPDPKTVPVYKIIEENNRRYPERYHMLSIGFTLFERAWSLTGMEQLMINLIMEPAFVHDLLERITDYNIGVIQEAARTGGIDCVHLADDWGSQNSLLISREMWQEFVKPGFKKTCQAIRSLGLAVSLHSCGNVADLIPDMIECGVDVFDPFQPEAMDIWKIHDRYSDRISFWGGLSVQKTFPYGTREDVVREGKRLLTVMGRKGGYIFSPSHTLTGDIPPENIQAFLELANNQ